MRFTVPQFIEYEAKVIGPFTFKQFIYVGIAGAICFVLYFAVPFSIFLIACFVLGGGAMAFALVKVGGRSLPAIIANIFKFSLSPKTYIWKKREKPSSAPPSHKATDGHSKAAPFAEVATKAESADEEGLPLKIAADSQLKKLRTTIETKNK